MNNTKVLCKSNIGYLLLKPSALNLIANWLQWRSLNVNLNRSIEEEHIMTADKKKFPPIFWIAFAILVVINLSVFFDYSKPLDKYQRFAGVTHKIELKPASVLKDVVRDGQALAQCTVASGGMLTWQSFASGVASYQFAPLQVATPGKFNENTICQAGDMVNINSLSEDNHNTQLVLLSIDFNNPLK